MFSEKQCAFNKKHLRFCTTISINSNPQSCVLCVGRTLQHMPFPFPFGFWHNSFLSNIFTWTQSRTKSACTKSDFMYVGCVCAWLPAPLLQVQVDKLLHISPKFIRLCYVIWKVLTATFVSILCSKLVLILWKLASVWRWFLITHNAHTCDSHYKITSTAPVLISLVFPFQVPIQAAGATVKTFHERKVEDQDRPTIHIFYSIFIRLIPVRQGRSNRPWAFASGSRYEIKNLFAKIIEISDSIKLYPYQKECCEINCRRIYFWCLATCACDREKEGRTTHAWDTNMGGLCKLSWSHS